MLAQRSSKSRQLLPRLQYAAAANQGSCHYTQASVAGQHRPPAGLPNMPPLHGTGELHLQRQPSLDSLAAVALNEKRPQRKSGRLQRQLGESYSETGSDEGGDASGDDTNPGMCESEEEYGSKEAAEDAKGLGSGSDSSGAGGDGLEGDHAFEEGEGPRHKRQRMLGAAGEGEQGDVGSCEGGRGMSQLVGKDMEGEDFSLDDLDPDDSGDAQIIARLQSSKAKKDKQGRDAQSHGRVNKQAGSRKGIGGRPKGSKNKPKIQPPASESAAPAAQSQRAAAEGRGQGTRTLKTEDPTLFMEAVRNRSSTVWNVAGEKKLLQLAADSLVSNQGQMGKQQLNGVPEKLMNYMRVELHCPLPPNYYNLDNCWTKWDHLKKKARLILNAFQRQETQAGGSGRQLTLEERYDMAGVEQEAEWMPLFCSLFEGNPSAVPQAVAEAGDGAAQDEEVEREHQQVMAAREAGDRGQVLDQTLATTGRSPSRRGRGRQRGSGSTSSMLTKPPSGTSGQLRAESTLQTLIDLQQQQHQEGMHALHLQRQQHQDSMQAFNTWAAHQERQVAVQQTFCGGILSLLSRLLPPAEVSSNCGPVAASTMDMGMASAAGVGANALGSQGVAGSPMMFGGNPGIGGGVGASAPGGKGVAGTPVMFGNPGMGGGVGGSAPP
ncbi:hypothetical protein DUNSADRAFT_8464, partial [Dunaliella salina]